MRGPTACQVELSVSRPRTVCIAKQALRPKLVEGRRTIESEEEPEEKEEEDPFGYDTVRGATYLDRAVMTYERYRFVLCFENSRVSGYVTANSPRRACG